MATIKPRVVAPGALKRWSRQAAGLVGRQFHLWLCLSCLNAGILFLLAKVPPLAFLAGLAAFQWSMAIAARSDQERLTPAELVRLLPIALRGALHFVMDHPFMVGIFILFSVWLGVTAWIPHTTFVLPLPPYPAWLTPPMLWTAGVSLMVTAMVMGDMEGEAYVYALRDWHETPLETARKLAREGIRKNRLTQLWLGVGCVLAAMALTLLISWLIPLLYCLIPALFYVAFRDIFLHQDENGALRQGIGARVPMGVDILAVG
jgi:hypothetical protein